MVGSDFKMVVGPLFSSEGIAEPVMNRYKLLVASWIGVFFCPQKKACVPGNAPVPETHWGHGLSPYLLSSKLPRVEEPGQKSAGPSSCWEAETCGIDVAGAGCRCCPDLPKRGWKSRSSGKPRGFPKGEMFLTFF